MSRSHNNPCLAINYSGRGGGGERGRRYYKFYSVLGRVVQLLSDGEEVSYTERKNVGVCLDSSSYVHVVDSCARRAAFKFQIVRRIHLSGGCAWSVYDKVALSHRTRRAVRSASPRLASPFKIRSRVSGKGENSKGDF